MDFTEAQVEQLKEMVSATVNAAIASRDKQTDKKRDSDKLELKKMIEETVATLKPAPATEEEQVLGGKKKDVEFEQLKRRMDETQRELETQRNETKAERQKNLAAMERTVGVRTLTENGLDPVRAELCFDVLKARGRIGLDEETQGTVVYNGEDGFPLPIKDGIKVYLKSDEAKIFLPPKDLRGSGSRPGGRPPLGGDGKPTKDQQLGAINELLDRSL